jgi:hypothetical protein
MYITASTVIMDKMQEDEEKESDEAVLALFLYTWRREWGQAGRKEGRKMKINGERYKKDFLVPSTTP